MSRTITMWMAALALIGLTAGCMDNKDALRNNVNAIYTNVMLIINDPEIKCMIDTNSWKELKKAEERYLAAKMLLQEKDISFENEKEALIVIAECADVLLLIIDGLDVSEEYKPVITAAKLSVNTLRNSL